MTVSKELKEIVTQKVKEKFDLEREAVKADWLVAEQGRLEARREDFDDLVAAIHDIDSELGEQIVRYYFSRNTSYCDKEERTFAVAVGLMREYIKPRDFNHYTMGQENVEKMRDIDKRQKEETTALLVALQYTEKKLASLEEVLAKFGVSL